MENNALKISPNNMAAPKTRPRPVFLLYALCGMLAALPMVFPPLWILSWIAPVPVLAVSFFIPPAGKHALRRAYGRGLAFFYCWGLIVFYWFVELYPLDFAGLDKWGSLAVILVAWFGLPLLQGVFSAFVFLFIHILSVKFKTRGRSLILSLGAASLWIFFEWLQTLTWAGVPWGKLALTQTGWLPLFQSASLFGSYTVSFLIISCASLLACAIYYWKKCFLRRGAALVAAAMCVLGGNLVYGLLRCSLYQPRGETITVAAIQGNIDSSEKWDNKTNSTLDVHENLTLEAAADGADLILWPETALPYVYSAGGRLDEYLTGLADEAGVPILAGFFIQDKEQNLYNVIGKVDPDTGMGDTFYKKRRLVPFGEFVPMRDVVMFLIPPLSQLSALNDDVTPGTRPELFDTAWGKAGSVICFDSIYESLILDSVRAGANLLCISTNDSWFEDSAAVYEHNAHAKLRAVETGRYVVRAANTGISSIITPTGKVTKHLPPLVEGYILDEVHMISENTLYTMVGNILVLAAGVYIAALLLWPLGSKKIQEMAHDNSN
jgi:apolipoprotein N-acyltransferase